MKSTEKLRESLISFSLIMAPLYAILFSLKESPFNYTLSMIGNWFDNRINFIVWGIITSFLLLIPIIGIYNKISFNNKRARLLVKLSMLFLILTVITPTAHSEVIYHEIEERLLYFNLHGLFAVLFGIFLLTSLFLFAKSLSKIDKDLSVKSIRLLLISIGGSIVTLFFFGMTGVFELFFFISLSVFLLITNKELRLFI